MTAQEALARLKDGNDIYLGAVTPVGDVSPARREDTCANGQRPFAAVVACSDSRVIPESIFSAGIGEIFTVRSAGNTIGPGELGSVEYAVEHLRVPLVVVLGHTHCGAVDAALHGGGEGHVRAITDEILRAVGDEADPDRACVLNVRRSVDILRRELAPLPRILGAVYHIDDGKVVFLD